MKIISFINPKGGVGKTTSAYNTAAVLSEMNHKVLLLDLDPHGGLSKKFDIDPKSLERSLFQFLNDPFGRHHIKNFISKTSYPLIDIIPGHRDLEALDQILVSQTDIYPFIFTHDNVGLSACRRAYKYVIIDSQPRYSPLVISALHASDLCVVPFIPETDTAEAFAELREVLENDIIKKGGLNYKVLFTMTQIYTVHHSVLIRAIMEAAPEKVFKTVIKRSIAVADSHSSHLPLVMRNKTHPVAKSYRSFTKELLHYVEKK